MVKFMDQNEVVLMIRAVLAIFVMVCGSMADMLSTPSSHKVWYPKIEK